MNTEKIVKVVAECGDLMLAKECVAALRSASFGGSVKLESPSQIEELETRRFGGFGSPVGEAAARGAAMGGFIGVATAVILSRLPLARDVNELALAALLASLGALVGGLAALIRATSELKQRRNTRGWLLCCQGTSTEIANALTALRDAPCRELRVLNTL